MFEEDLETVESIYQQIQLYCQFHAIFSLDDETHIDLIELYDI